jgi:hypothetical protein
MAFIVGHCFLVVDFYDGDDFARGAMATFRARHPDIPDNGTHTAMGLIHAVNAAASFAAYGDSVEADVGMPVLRL